MNANHIPEVDYETDVEYEDEADYYAKNNYVARAEKAIATTDTWDGAAVALAILALAKEISRLNDILLSET